MNFEEVDTLELEVFEVSPSDSRETPRLVAILIIYYYYTSKMFKSLKSILIGELKTVKLYINLH